MKPEYPGCDNPHELAYRGCTEQCDHWNSCKSEIKAKSIEDERNSLVEKARATAIQAHRGQTRRKSGEPYIEHPRRVAEAVKGDIAKAIAWLHDVLEDGGIDIHGLHAKGLPLSVIADVVDLTRQKDETYFHYIMRLKDCNVYTIAVKLADLKDNMRDLEEGSLKDKYRFAEWVLLHGGNIR